MTEKRFIGSGGGIYDQYKGDRFTWSEWEEILRLMNNLNEKARERSKALSKLQKENEQLKKQLQKIQDSFEVNWTQNYIEFDRDRLYIKDNNTEIRLNDRNLFIEVYIPQIDEYYRFRYIVTGRSSEMREFIENY